MSFLQDSSGTSYFESKKDLFDHFFNHSKMSKLLLSESNDNNGHRAISP